MGEARPGDPPRSTWEQYTDARINLRAQTGTLTLAPANHVGDPRNIPHPDQSRRRTRRRFLTSTNHVGIPAEYSSALSSYSMLSRRSVDCRVRNGRSAAQSEKDAAVAGLTPTRRYAT
eukprot:4232411-Pyramimonas_sp.AAC.1